MNLTYPFEKNLRGFSPNLFFPFYALNLSFPQVEAQTITT